MELLIHTYGRPHAQKTWESVGLLQNKDVKLVVQERERHLYKNYPVVVLPGELTKLAETRQWLYSEYSGAEKIVILDDDLVFAARRSDDPTKFRPAELDDLETLFNTMEGLLGPEHPLVGVGAREGGNRITDHLVRCTRQMRVHGIYVPTYRELGVRFDRVLVMEDFDDTLQFIRHGKPNVVLNKWVTNQHGSNLAGGCSHYRTQEVQEESARKLAELHPGLVSVVKKAAKNWGWAERTDVTVGWKKAFRAPYKNPARAGT